MNAPPFPPFPPFPANPTVGQKFGDWVWNGAQWIPAAGGGVLVNVQVFTAVGQTLTYIPSPGILSAVVEAIGGGGGGGPAISPGPTYVLSGGGGGSGGYSRKVLNAALVLGGANVTVGAGGTPTGNGQATAFGALCIANGGGAGVGNNASGGWGQGGAPAPPGTGDVTMPGSGGHNGVLQVFASPVAYAATAGGSGGAMWGGAIANPETGVGGTANGSGGWNGTGAGGGGGCVNQSALNTSAQGGAGGSGICWVTEYCSGDAGGGCGGQAPVAWQNCGPGWGGPC